MLMYGVEGLDVAERYNGWGVTAFVLTFGCRRGTAKTCASWRETRRATGSRARRRIQARPGQGRLHRILGGLEHGRGRWSAASGPGDPNAADPVDRLSSRPDYLVLVYGAGRATPGESLKNFPPTFLVSAAADTGPSLGNAQLFMDLTRAGAVAEIHVYQKGRHGFGSGFGSREFSATGCGG